MFKISLNVVSKQTPVHTQKHCYFEDEWERVSVCVVGGRGGGLKEVQRTLSTLLPALPLHVLRGRLRAKSTPT